jgi:hypothetical protein
MNSEQGDPKEDEDLPDPEFETVRNQTGLFQQIWDGLLLALGNDDENATRLGTLWGVLEHFEKLYQAVQADQFGTEVRGHGALASVPGGRDLIALVPAAGSFALPLRLVPPDGELVGADYRELEALMGLLSPDADLSELLPTKPDRIGNELRRLYAVLAGSGTGLAVTSVRDGSAVSQLHIGSDTAQLRVDWLDAMTPHDLGSRTLRGRLFRIDTKKSEVRIDAVDPDGGEESVEKATFEEDQLEALRDALGGQVEIEASVTEERRPYESPGIRPTLHIRRLRSIEEDGE